MSYFLSFPLMLLGIDITSREVIDIGILILLAILIGALVGWRAKKKNATAINTFISAPIIATLVLCFLAFILTLVTQDPNDRSLSRALGGTIFISIGIAVFGSLPAIIGSVITFKCCKSAKDSTEGTN